MRKLSQSRGVVPDGIVHGKPLFLIVESRSFYHLVIEEYGEGRKHEYAILSTWENVPEGFEFVAFAPFPGEGDGLCLYSRAR